MNNEILISVLVSVYNSEKFFKGKIEDLLSQTIADKIEIIIINSGSRQNEDAIFKKEFSSIKSIKYIKTEERETIYKAWNRGLKIAKGKYTTNANCDDRLRKDAYEIMSKYLDENPDTALVYGDQYFSGIPNEKYDEIKKKKVKTNSEYSRIKLLDKYMIGSQPMWRASLHFSDNMWFDENYEVAGDYDFVCRISEKYNIAKINSVLGTYYRSSSNQNKEFQDFARTLAEARDIQIKYSVPFANAISEKEIKAINVLHGLYKICPNKAIVILKRIIRKIWPNIEPFEKCFVLLMKILIEKKRGNIIGAKQICDAHKDYDLVDKLYRKYSGL